MSTDHTILTTAAELIRNARRTCAFTGAGISVESGIPPFRGPEGLWSRYDPTCLDLSYFMGHSEEAWRVIKEIFYDFFGEAAPNAAHLGLARLEREGLVQTVITQNIDNLHQEAGSANVYEFHGSSRTLHCLDCLRTYEAPEISLETLPPACTECGGVLKPNFVFFGEAIPEKVSARSFAEAELCDVMIVIGTTGEIMPACMVPRMAKHQGASIIEINPEPSEFTNSITDHFIQARATDGITLLLDALKLE